MKFLIILALVAIASGVPVKRIRRSFDHYSNPGYYNGNQQYYSAQAVSSPVYSEPSPALYSLPVATRVSSPPLYNTQSLPHASSLYNVPYSSPAVYRNPVSYVQSPSYVSIPQVQSPQVFSSPLYNTPVNHVSVPGVYNAEHSSHSASSSHYKVQGPVDLAYNVQVPHAQYVSSPTWQHGGAWGN